MYDKRCQHVLWNVNTILCMGISSSSSSSSVIVVLCLPIMCGDVVLMDFPWAACLVSELKVMPEASNITRCAVFETSVDIVQALSPQVPIYVYQENTLSP